VADDPEAGSKADGLLTTLMKTVWWAIGLGLAIQIVVMVANQIWPESKIISEVAQKVSWSVLVCSALAVGNSLSSAKPVVMGLVGLLSAPLAFNAARIVQRGLSAGGAAGAVIPAAVELSLAKALEYVAFGVLIAYAARSGRAREYLLSGLATAAVFTAYLELRLVYGNSPTPAGTMLFARGINEFLFPIGCALVQWFTAEIGTQLASSATSTGGVDPARAA
jgi:hypothetical protein